MLRVFGPTPIVCALLAVLLLPALSPRAIWAEEPAAIDFNRQIRPLLVENCLACHGPDDEARQAGLRLDDKSSVLGRLASGAAAVVPGDPGRSELLARVSSQDESRRMPPADADQKPLAPAQVALLRRWIEQGAPWETHWAYQPPRKGEPPPIENTAWPRNAIDHYTLARMEAAGLKPTEPARREAWLRRVTFDLTGLPPTIEELDAFLADDSPTAYATVVDRLLRSPRYGERMASHWLDLARYADTHGYHVDAHRDMWRWRDWVIEAFNSNMRFDRFTVAQLAGDLLPDPTLEQLIATGFNRNAMINYENGSIAEEYRTEYVVDRVVTTASVWMGQTMLCARCHDHKFDSFSQREFYALYAFFNNVPEQGLDGTNGNAAPLIPAPTREQTSQRAALRANIAKLESELERRAAGLLPRQPAWERALLEGEDALSAPPRDMSHYLTLDETQGDKVRDACDESRHGVIRGAPIRVSGKFNQALLFTGQTHIDLGDVADYERDAAFTAAAWVFPTTGDSTTLMARLASTARSRGWEWSLENDRIVFRLVHDGAANSLEVRSKGAVPRNAWRHLAVGYDGSGEAAGVSIFVDGELAAVEIVHDQLDGSIRNRQPLLVGRQGENVGGFRGMLDELRLYDRALSATDVARLAGGDPIREIARTAVDKRTESQAAALRNYFLREDDSYLASSEELSTTRKHLRSLEASIPTTMVMQEMDPPRETRLLIRGDYRQPGPLVTPDTPACLPPFPAEAPRNRLGLAQWLVDPGHPLTARVTVNHFWQMIFGTGLVATSEDFGVRGETPSHGELLDWLAVDFVESGWDVKRLLRMMVLSATYRQSAAAPPELLARDPDNRLLARGPRHHLPAEMVRDHALASAGLLRERLGGPSVFPYQPEGLWEEISFNPELYTAQVYLQSEGADVYRRSLYTFWKRTAPPPTLSIFNAPNREICAMRRPQTTTTLQALALLNDPTFVEAARVLTERMLSEAGDSADERIAFAFRRLTSRLPTPVETSILRRVHQEQLAHFRAHPDDAQRLLTVGESPRNRRLDDVELASWTVVASMLMNLQETMMK
ncbi:MAG: DUF1553 domain-containing protein [Pirellulaceae bacterium]